MFPNKLSKVFHDSGIKLQAYILYDAGNIYIVLSCNMENFHIYKLCLKLFFTINQFNNVLIFHKLSNIFYHFVEKFTFAYATVVFCEEVSPKIVQFRTLMPPIGSEV